MSGPVVMLKIISFIMWSDSVVYDASFSTMDRCEIARAEFEKMKTPWGLKVRYKCIEL